MFDGELPEGGFPPGYWDPTFELYTYLPAFFEEFHVLNEIEIPKPPRDGDVIQQELDDLLDMQEDKKERKARKEEIKFEADNITNKFFNALLVGRDAGGRVNQIVDAMNDVGLYAVLYYKKKYMRARPNQLEPAIEPLIRVPGHPAYPSGHSTQNFLIAHGLSEIVGDDAELIARIFEIARRVAVNREWAGVHYKSDTEAGEILARELFPTVRHVFADLFEEATSEWRNLPIILDAGTDSADEETEEATTDRSQTFPPGNSLFKEQWNLKNVGRHHGKPGVDINILPAWEALGIDERAFSDFENGAWETDSKITPTRVLLLDMAVDFRHKALKAVLSYEHAQNLDYPTVVRKWSELSEETRALVTEEEVTEDFIDSFSSVSSGHGTACAGVIAASVLDDGTLGIAPRSKIIPYRAMTLTEPVLKKRQVLARAVLEIFKNGTSRTSRLADILYCPLPFRELASGKIEDDPLPFAFHFAATKIPVILASGNDGTSEMSYMSDIERFERYVRDPSGFDDLVELFGIAKSELKSLLGLPDDDSLKGLIKRIIDQSGLITVGACNNKGFRSRYSQFGEHLTVVAPSDDELPPKSADDRENDDRPPEDDKRRSAAIATTDSQGTAGFEPADDLYTLSSNHYGFGGTSAASAQVAGVVALMLEANPDLGPKDVREILCRTARTNLLMMDYGRAPTERTDQFGHGLVDAGAAVKEAKAAKPTKVTAAVVAPID